MYQIPLNSGDKVHFYEVIFIVGPHSFFSSKRSNSLLEGGRYRNVPIRARD